MTREESAQRENGQSSSRPPLAAKPRAVALIVVLALCGVLLARELHFGWFPHDEGALGQSAERVLGGEVPHRDFDELYTGLLTYLHAAAFSAWGIRATALRIPLFIGTIVWLMSVFAIGRRFMSDTEAAIVTVITFVWSVPNYPASLPSWYNLFFATFGVHALIRWREGGAVRWLLLAGTAGGISFLFKLSGVFYLLGGGLSLIAATVPPLRESHGARDRGGAILVIACLIVVAGVLALPLARAGMSELTRFGVPMAVVFGALAVREWRHSTASAWSRGREMLRTGTPFAVGALVPIALYFAVMLSKSALDDTLRGVFVVPFRRVDSAAIHPPNGLHYLWSLVFGALLLPRRPRARTVWAACFAATILLLAVVAAPHRQAAYDIAWYSAWGLPLLVAVAAAGYLTRHIRHPAAEHTGIASLLIVAVCVLLVEFPFASSLYTLYALPLSILALACYVQADDRAPRSGRIVAAAFMFGFGFSRAVPLFDNSFGITFLQVPKTSPLRLDRAGLHVKPSHAVLYDSLIPFVQQRGAAGTLWAGPDAPEVYFLSGLKNHTRTMFDFLGYQDRSAGALARRVLELGPTVVVLNREPSFSDAPDSTSRVQLERAYPHTHSVGPFLVLWK